MLTIPHPQACEGDGENTTLQCSTIASDNSQGTREPTKVSKRRERAECKDFKTPWSGQIQKENAPGRNTFFHWGLVLMEHSGTFLHINAWGWGVGSCYPSWGCLCTGGLLSIKSFYHTTLSLTVESFIFRTENLFYMHPHNQRLDHYLHIAQ